MDMFTADGRFIAPTMPGKLEAKLQELNQLVDQFNPDELGPWLDFVRSHFTVEAANQTFVSLCLAHAQKLYAASHGHRYYEYREECFCNGK